MLWMKTILLMIITFLPLFGKKENKFGVYSCDFGKIKDKKDL